MENVEKRLELIKMMRDEHEENIGRIRRREHILYPERKLSYSETENFKELEKKTYFFSYNVPEKNTIDSVSQNRPIGFYARLGISIMLFLLFFYMDMNQTEFWGITCNTVQNVISDTIDLKSFAFMEQFSYTLE